MTLLDVCRVFKAAIIGWMDDYAQSMGAALAYYTLFSVAPLLLIVISIAGLVFGEEAARGEIYGQLNNMLGASGALAVQGLLESVRQPAASGIGALFGIAVALVGATAVFAELQDALDRIWRAPVRTGPSGILGLIRARLLSFGLILGVGFLLMVSLVASAALAALDKWWGPVFSQWSTVANIVELGSSYLAFTGVFAVIYKTMPRVDIDWKDVWIGAAVTSLLFTLGKSLISTYIGRSGIASGFGAAASLVVVLIWVYYSAQVFLLGAEFTWAYANLYGSRKNFATDKTSTLDLPRKHNARQSQPPT
jgi:membrane protein